VIPTLWIPPLDEPEPGDYPQKNDSVHRTKISVSPVKRRVTSAMIVPGEINMIIIKEITPSITPKSERAKPKKMKSTQTTKPSKIVSFTMSNYLEMKLSKW